MFIQVKPFRWGTAKVVTSRYFIKLSDDFRAYFFEVQNRLCIIYIVSIITGFDIVSKIGSISIRL